MTVPTTKTGVFPGSFNPPTIAHLAIIEAARRHHQLDRVDLAISRRALAKEDVDHPRFEHRIAVIHNSLAELPWAAVTTTTEQLLADIAEGYDLVIMGADKWWQIHELRWYQSAQHREETLERLPEVAVFPRNGFDNPPDITLQLDDEALAMVSSSRARSGEKHLMTAAARRFAEQTGAWIDPERYERQPHNPAT